MSRRSHRAALAAVLLVGMLSLSGCGYHPAIGQFFVESSSDGYYVDVDAFGVPYSVRVSKPFKSPVDADILAQKLNRDIAGDGHWYIK